MADDERKPSPSRFGTDVRSRVGGYRFQGRHDSKKSDAPAQRPPWEADLKPRARRSPRPADSPQESTTTPRWGAPATTKTPPAPAKKPIPSPTKSLPTAPSLSQSADKDDGSDVAVTESVTIAPPIASDDAETVTIATSSVSLESEPVTMSTPSVTIETEPVNMSTPSVTIETEPVTMLTPSVTIETEPVTMSTPSVTIETEPVTMSTPSLTKDTEPVTILTPSITLDSEPVAMETQEPADIATSEQPTEASFTLGEVTISTEDSTPSDLEPMKDVQESQDFQPKNDGPIFFRDEDVCQPKDIMPTRIAKPTKLLNSPTEDKQDPVTQPKVQETKIPTALQPSGIKPPTQVIKPPTQVIKPPTQVVKPPVQDFKPQPVQAIKPQVQDVKPQQKVQDVKPPEDNKVDAQTLKMWEVEAANGSEEYQTKLGKHFLSLADSDVDREKNAGLALDWLIQASKQGGEEATTLLKKCVDRDMPGIDQRDASDLKWCINTSSYEKKLRSAARNLFQKINTTHKDAITRDEYMDAIKGLTGKVTEQKLLMAAGKKIGKNISENEFIMMLSKKIQGTVTLTSSELADSSVSYESAGYVTKVLKYPKQTAANVMDQVLEYSSAEGLNWIVSMIPTNQLYMLGLLFVYSFLTPDFIFFMVPLFIFYLSFAAIIICTLQMFYKKRKQKDAATLAGVLKDLDVSIDLDKTESQYTWNSLTPYIVFFVNLPLVVMSFSLSNKAYVPCAEVCVVSFVMTGLCFFSLSDHHDKLTIFALLANLLSSLPVFLHNFPAVPFLTQIIGLLCDPFFALDTGVGIKFNISVPSIAYLAMPLFFARMAIKNSWEGTYRVLVPHLVCYFWFNIVTSTFPFTSWFGLGRATVGYLLLPIVLPLSAVGVFVMAAFGIYKAFQTAMLGKVIVTFVLLSVPILMTQSKKIFGQNFEAKFGVAKKVLMKIFALLALVPLIFVKIPQWKKEVVIELSYENYTQLCFREKVVNDVPQQVTCSHLEGTKVKWNGTVEGVTVTKIENTAESVLKSLPTFIAKPLYCMYGQEYPQCDRKLLSKKGYSFCTIMRGMGHECHVKNHNTYNFEILALTESQNVKIEAGDHFKETVLALEIGDVIEYKGTLKDNLGGTVPVMRLTSVKATNRDLPIMMKIDDEDDRMMTAVQDAIAVTFNFIWYPLLEFEMNTGN